MPIRHLTSIITTALLLLIAPISYSEPSAWGLENTESLRLGNIKAAPVSYKGRKGLRLSTDDETDTLAILKDLEFTNGTISLEVVGTPREGAPPVAKGFVGIAFRVQEESPASYECFYIRPLNSHAKSKVQRDHSVQYVSPPEYEWPKLRRSDPGKYEAYADLSVGEWTDLRIEVKNKTAKFYVNGDKEPCLVVNDLKLGKRKGAVAIWTHATTDAYVRNLRIDSDD